MVNLNIGNRAVIRFGLLPYNGNSPKFNRIVNKVVSVHNGTGNRHVQRPRVYAAVVAHNVKANNIGLTRYNGSGKPSKHSHQISHVQT
jgi:hypothetical protein